MVMITLFPICYLSQLKHLDMKAIVLGTHARLPSFIKLKPSGLWELKIATNYIHYVILTMYICNFPNKRDEDWYWSVEILYTLAIFTLFDQSLQKSFDFDSMKEILSVNSVRANGKRKCCCKKIR